MWRVSKLHRGTEPTRVQIPATTFDPMLRWYTGKGSSEDEAIGVRLVRDARSHDRWFACDCLGEKVRPPLLSPAYIAEAQTFYLRRLTGAERPKHLEQCPFHRDQADYTPIEREAARIPVKVPDGFFAVLKPVGSHLAQASDGVRDSRSNATGPPLLARLLWQLIEHAGINVIDAVHDRPAPSIAREFGRLRDAARDMRLAPGVPLHPLLFTHVDDLRSNRIYARLRAAAGTWPADHEPQAFLLMFARTVGRREIFLADGPPVTIASNIVRPAGDAGPFLILVTIGNAGAKRGYEPLRAYAQPILDGHHFVPVASADERRLLAELLQLQRPLDAAGVTSRIKKPLFDIETNFGPCRPPLMVDVARASDGLERMNIVELLAANRSTNDEEQLGYGALGEIVSIDPERLDHPRLNGDLTRALTGAEKLNCGAASVASGVSSSRAIGGKPVGFDYSSCSAFTER